MKLVNQNKCILCGAGNFEILLRKERYENIRCKKCGLIFANPIPIMTKEERSELNINAWYPNLAEFNIYDFHKRPEYKRQFNAFYKYVKGGKILDVECGTGYFLLAAKMKGFEVVGVEVSEKAARYVKSLGIEVFVGELSDAKLPSNYFDGVRIAQVLEHLATPVETLKNVNRILKIGGILQIGVPNEQAISHNLKNLYHRITRRYKKDKYSCWVYPPVHLYGFTKRSLTLLLTKTGFNILHSFSTGRGDRIYAPFVFTKQLKIMVEEVIDFIGSGIGKGALLYVYAHKAR